MKDTLEAARVLLVRVARAMREAIGVVKHEEARRRHSLEDRAPHTLARA